MLTPERLRTLRGEEGALTLLRDLGYDIAPVDIDPDEWRRGGVSIPWNSNARFRLASRMLRFYLFLLSGQVGEEAVAEFLCSYQSYNQVTKSAVVYCNDESIAVFDITAAKTLRRLDGADRLPQAESPGPGATETSKEPRR